MKNLLIIILLFSSVASAQSDLCSLAEEALKTASAIRGLEAKSKVKCQSVAKEEIRKFLQKSIDEKLAPNKLKNEELIFKAVGMIPADFDYKQKIVDIYENEIGGYYDPEEKAYFLASWVPAEAQGVIAVHELTHALQDQHYDLKKFVDNKFNSDELTAHSALAEGDATAVMLDYMRLFASLPTLSKDKDLSRNFDIENLSNLSVNLGIPASLKELIIFPYSSGVKFVHQLLLKGGYEQVNQAFINPPQTTEEILHPEIYLNKQKSYEDISEQKLIDEFGLTSKPIYTDIFGEVGIKALALMFVSSKDLAAKLAAGWGGDRIIVASEKQIIWQIYWDELADNLEFTTAYQKGLIANKCKLVKGQYDCPERRVTFKPDAKKLNIIYDLD